MLFLYPAFLWALLAVLIPVVIHLFNFRRYKTVYFSNVKFLQQLQVQSRSQSRIRQWLILLLRCLFIAALVFCFAQPFIPNDKKFTAGKQQIISVYIDNSFSMQNENADGPLLQIAKQQVKDICNTIGNNAQFHLITNDFEGKHQRLYSREDFLNLVEEVKISPSPRTLSEVIKRQKNFLDVKPGMNCSAYIFSDFQKSQTDFAQLEPDSTIRYSLLPLAANKLNNLALDSCWFSTPLQQKGFVQKLNVRLKNYGTAKIELSAAKLLLNNQQVAMSSFSILPNASTNLQFTFENQLEGENTGSVRIEDHPVVFDDQLFFSFNARTTIAVSLINGKDQPAANALSRLFSGDSLFKLYNYNESAVDYSVFKKSNCIVLNGLSEISSGLLAELKNYAAKGGVLFFVPALEADMTSYHSYFESFKLAPIGTIDTNRLRSDQLQFASDFFNDVFERKDERMNLPEVRKHYSFPANAGDAEILLRLQNNDPLLFFKRQGNTNLFVLSTSLTDEGSNFHKHALFVPVIYKLCFSSLIQRPLFYTTGKDERIDLPTDSLQNEQPPHITDSLNKTDVIPEIRIVNGIKQLFTKTEIQQAGIYELQQNNRVLGKLAFNFSRKESDLVAYDSQELTLLTQQKRFSSVKVLEGNSKQLAKALTEETEGKKLWKIFLILALVFLSLELAVLRYLK